LPEYPKKYSLKIKTTGSAEDKKLCEKIANKILNLLKVRHTEGKLFNYRDFKYRVKHGTLFDIFDKPDAAHKKYNPKYWRLVARYWYYHLKHTKSGQNDKYHLIPSLKQFGRQYALDIQPSHITQWLEGQYGN
jgi:hypothetical protein